MFVLITFLDVNASIKQFSTNLISTHKAIPEKVSPTTKLYKAGISEGRLPELKTAVLWHAPPYKSLSVKLSPSEELEVDQVAMQILIDGAAEKNQDIMKAKTIKSWSRKAKEEASSTINELSNYIYSSYQELKPFYQMTTHRNINVIERSQQAQSKLELISGSESVTRVQALFNGERI